MASELDCMHILLVSPYFTPDTPPYAAIVDAITHRFAVEGHEVVVLTAQPTYNRAVAGRSPRREHRLPNLEVRRFPAINERRRVGLARLVNTVGFCAWVVGARRWFDRADLVIAASSPPIVLGLAGLSLARLTRAVFAYHKQDIHPDAATAVGESRFLWLSRLLRSIDSWTDRRSDYVLVLSEDMVTTELGRGVDRRSLRAINNFDPWQVDLAAAEVEIPNQRVASELRIVFAGNLGRYQGLRCLLDAAAMLLDRRDVRFDLVGDGVMRPDLEREAGAAGLSNVTFHGYVDPAKVAHMLGQPRTVGLVSLEPGVIRTAYPSKTMSYLRNGCPVVAVVEPSSELARGLRQADAGMSVTPGDPEALADIIRRLASDPGFVEAMGRAAKALFDKSFSKESRLEDWATFAAEVSSRRAG